MLSLILQDWTAGGISSFARLARLGINLDNPFLFAKSIVARVSLKKKRKKKKETTLLLSGGFIFLFLIRYLKGFFWLERICVIA